ncbi:Leucine-rich repeat,Leucine-rich repeat domain, L domain-like [Cinara cedri]|uniref:Dynein axonemal assembly factor 1 homolog n=1 Tax=Cinara cedri TaxID=506608 RepID=A0A5E4NJS0_9HEMI|nr:Leucine-rich repeat,Leucine-rich repeat domain, L domain-like [Cinara cedri]
MNIITCKNDKKNTDSDDCQPKRNLNRMTEDVLREICKKNKLYRTPHLNNVLYLHFKGFSKIENLESYTGLKALWLENNCITEICGLDNQTELTCLYLHNNVIKKIEHLDNLTKLDTVNLCYNFISKIENLNVLPVLTMLQMAHNILTTANDIAQLAECKELAIVDLSYNNLNDPKIVEIFGKMKSLRVLTLTGNPVISKIGFYRKTMTLVCRSLCHLDERTITERDRLCAEAWRIGGLEAEQATRKRLINDDYKRISASVNALIKRRKQGCDNNDDLDDGHSSTQSDGRFVCSDDYSVSSDSETSSTDDELADNVHHTDVKIVMLQTPDEVTEEGGHRLQEESHLATDCRQPSLSDEKYANIVFSVSEPPAYAERTACTKSTLVTCEKTMSDGSSEVSAIATVDSCDLMIDCDAAHKKRQSDSTLLTYDGDGVTDVESMFWAGDKQMGDGFAEREEYQEIVCNVVLPIDGDETVGNGDACHTIIQYPPVALCTDINSDAGSDYDTCIDGNCVCDNDDYSSDSSLCSWFTCKSSLSHC